MFYSQNVDNIKLVMNAHIAERVGAGEDWQVYVKRLSGGLEVSAGRGQMRAASLIKLYIMGAVYSDYDEIVNEDEKETVDSLLLERYWFNLYRLTLTSEDQVQENGK